MLPCSRCVQGIEGTGATAMAAPDMLRPTCNQLKLSQWLAHLAVIVMPRTSPSGVRMQIIVLHLRLEAAQASGRFAVVSRPIYSLSKLLLHCCLHRTSYQWLKACTVVLLVIAT